MKIYSQEDKPIKLEINSRYKIYLLDQCGRLDDIDCDLIEGFPIGRYTGIKKHGKYNAWVFKIENKDKKFYKKEKILIDYDAGILWSVSFKKI